MADDLRTLSQVELFTCESIIKIPTKQDWWSIDLPFGIIFLSSIDFVCNSHNETGLYCCFSYPLKFLRLLAFCGRLKRYWLRMWTYPRVTLWLLLKPSNTYDWNREVFTAKYNIIGFKLSYWGKFCTRTWFHQDGYSFYSSDKQSEEATSLANWTIKSALSQFFVGPQKFPPPCAWKACLLRLWLCYCMRWQPVR